MSKYQYLKSGNWTATQTGTKQVIDNPSMPLVVKTSLPISYYIWIVILWVIVITLLALYIPTL